MAHVASVLNAHGVTVGNGIVAACYSYEQCSPDGGTADPCCCAVYRNQPWADVLYDMGSYSILTNEPKWMKVSSHARACSPLCILGRSRPNARQTGVQGHCPKDPNNDPKVVQYCGWEGGIMNVLHSPVSKIYAEQQPMVGRPR